MGQQATLCRTACCSLAGNPSDDVGGGGAMGAGPSESYQLPEGMYPPRMSAFGGEDPLWNFEELQVAVVDGVSRLSARLSARLSGQYDDECQLLQSVPLRVLPFPALEELGHLPRSTNCCATLANGHICGERHDHALKVVDDSWDLASNPIVMISHSWAEPSKRRPDNDANRKFEIVRRGTYMLCEEHALNVREMYVFLDWCSIAQESHGTPLFDLYVQSLPAFIAQMSFILIPLDSKLVLRDQLRLDNDLNPTQMNWAHYSQRGWCRLEMLAGRALAALGTAVRVYRFDATWGPDRERLIEVPPYTPGSHNIMPTAPDAYFTCCQRDHWDSCTRQAIRCDRGAVKAIEDLFSREVTTERKNRRKIFQEYAGDLLAVAPALGGIVVVPATTFLQLQEIPRYGTGATVVLQDKELADKCIFYFSNRFWRPEEHPDKPDGLKFRWMKKVLTMLMDQEGIQPKHVYIWQDYSSIDQDDKKMKELGWDSIPGLVARSTYFVVFATDEKGKSEGALDRAWIRRSIFVSRLMSSVGIYTATYMTKLADLNSLVGMTLQPLQCKLINPKTYTRQKPDAGQLHEDPLCPWTGKLTVEADRLTIWSQCEKLLQAAEQLPEDTELRRRMVQRCRMATASVQKEATDGISGATYLTLPAFEPAIGTKSLSSTVKGLVKAEL